MGSGKGARGVALVDAEPPPLNREEKACTLTSYCGQGAADGGGG